MRVNSANRLARSLGRNDLGGERRGRAFRRAGRTGSVHFVKDRANRAGTAAALGGTAEAAIDLPCRAHAAGIRQGISHLVIREDVARANNHRVAAGLSLDFF